MPKGFVGSLVPILAVWAVVAVHGDQTASGVIRGRAVDASSERPVDRVTITIHRSGGPIREVSAGADGRFEIAGLPFGVYSLRATRAGYLPGTFGARRPGGPGGHITVQPSQAVQIEVQMWRPVAIEGTVREASGEPIVGVTVHALRQTWSGNQARLETVASAVSDDRGQYRLSELEPAEYVVGVRSTRATLPESLTTVNTFGRGSTAVLPRGLVGQTNNIGFESAGGERALEVVPTTFAPRATTLDGAERVSLSSGETRSGVDVTLEHVRSWSVSGRLRAADGTPVAFAQLYLFPAWSAVLGSSAGFEAARAFSDSAGAYALYGVPAGVYTLRAVQIPAARPRAPILEAEVAALFARVGDELPEAGRRLRPPEAPTLWAESPVVVTEADAVVDVTLQRAARISGSLRFEGASPPLTAQQRQALGIVIDPADGRKVGVLRPDRVDASGAFVTYGAPPGRYLLRITGDVGRWRPHSIVMRERVLPYESIDLGSDDLSVTLVMTDAPDGEVRGRVRFPAAGSTDLLVIAFPAERHTWSDVAAATLRMRDAWVSREHPEFALAALMPGNYVVAAVPFAFDGRWQQPPVLEAAGSQGVTISVTSGPPVRTPDLAPIRIERPPHPNVAGK